MKIKRYKLLIIQAIIVYVLYGISLVLLYKVGGLELIIGVYFFEVARTIEKYEGVK